jgi:hypothetical protein
MKLPDEFLKPDRDAFSADPFGYSAAAWLKWGMACTLAGFPVDPLQPPTSEDLKSPVLWLSQAHALAEAASIVLRGDPSLKVMPEPIKAVCDCQYRAVGLMLVGYSLEISLKAMLIIRKGVDAYSVAEKIYRHHRLEQLADFIPDLTDKDKAILKGLTHFITWAGRYPDPGSGREGHAEEIFVLSESYQVAAKDLFSLAARVMGHVRLLLGVPDDAH